MKKLHPSNLCWRILLASVVAVVAVADSASGSNVIGFSKLENMAVQWLSDGCEPNDWCGGSDVDMDGEVDFDDFSRLAEKWDDYRRPNFLFILIDDLGKEWVSTYGGEGIETPNIDSLASGGMKFENAYSMPQCTPSRVALLTGQYPWRNGWVHHWDAPGGHNKFSGCSMYARFDPNVYTTFARTLKNEGYATAVAGKWQLNDFRDEPNVLNTHGFDEFCMWTGKETGVPEAVERYWDPYIHTSSGSQTYTGQFGPDIFTDFLIDFMTDHKDEPMMMYYPMVLTHKPLTTTPAEPNVVDNIDKHKAMVRYTDHLLGRLVDKLDELGIREHTIVFWTTDNGTAKSVTGTLNGRTVKGGKGSIKENGVNAPFIVNCPGVIAAGTVSNVLADFTDMFPTFSEFSGSAMPAGYVYDGKSIAHVLLGDDTVGTRDWICGLGAGGSVLNRDRVPPMPGVDDCQAVNVNDQKERGIRDKQYKLWWQGGVATALYDLLADPDEAANLIDSADPSDSAARDKLEAVGSGFPAVDAYPLYGPLD